MKTLIFILILLTVVIVNADNYKKTEVSSIDSQNLFSADDINNKLNYLSTGQNINLSEDLITNQSVSILEKNRSINKLPQNAKNKDSYVFSDVIEKLKKVHSEKEKKKKNNVLLLGTKGADQFYNDIDLLLIWR